MQDEQGTIEKSEMPAGGPADAAYESFIGRWSRVVAAEFVHWLAVERHSAWLDVACGTGALSEAIAAHGAPRLVLGIDTWTEGLRFAYARLASAGTMLCAADAQLLPVEDAAFDAAVSGLALNLVPDPAVALAAQRRAVRPGGTVAAYVWDFAGRMQIMRWFWDEAAAIDPAAREADQARRYPLARPESLAKLFAAAGLDGVAIRAIDTPAVFRDFDDYWSPILSGHGMLPGYCMSLPEAKRSALRERLRARLVPEADGRIRLVARAWAVRGTVPR